MPCLKVLRGILVINEDSSDEEELTEVVPDNEQSPQNSRYRGPSKDEIAEMSEIERRQEAQEEAKYKKGPTCVEKAFYDWKPRLCYVICLSIFLGLILPVILTQGVFRDQINHSSDKSCFISIKYRFPCHEGNEHVLDKSECENLGCCYDADTMQEDIRAPHCYHSMPSLFGYKLINSSLDQMMERKKPISLKNEQLLDVNVEGKVQVTLTSNTNKTPYNSTAYDLQVKVVQLDNNAIRIQIWNSDGTTPEDINPGVVENPLLQAYVTQDKEHNFDITVNRTETNETIFHTMGPLIFGDKYIEVSTQLPTRHLYGLGQRDAFDTNLNFDNWEEWPLFSTEGAGSGIRYGSQPFYMCFEESNMVHGVFLRHSGPLYVKLLPLPAVSFRLLTGYIDITVMAGPEPKDVSMQYASQDQVEAPAMPPYWAFGFHLCRTARNTLLYDNTTEMMDIHNIPYESDCIDAQLNYPDAFKPLTDEIKNKITVMQELGRKFIMAQYPFVTTDSEIYNIDTMLNFDDDHPYYGLVNGSAVGYPDYANGKTHDDLLNNTIINELYKMADGLMLLQNTPLNEAQVNYTEFTETSCSVGTPELCCGPNDASIYLSLPKSFHDLSDGTVCMNVMQKIANSGQKVSHLLNHNSYGKYHMKNIYTVVSELKPTVRPMVTSLSTHPGSSRYGGHFGGSYKPNFISAKKGLVQVLQMGLAGIPFTGTPLCGSINETKNGVQVSLQADWCLRAYQMNSFFPFMMSYTELGAELRDPTTFPKEVIAYLRLVILQRYMFLPYFYTLQWEASTSGVPSTRLLAYEFPQHLGSREITTQFMVGSSLMVTPVFSSITNLTSIEVEALFPPGCWYDYFSATMVSNSVDGKNLTLSSLLTDINLHVQGGHIIPMQGSTKTNVTTTDEFRLEPYKLIVALSCNPPQIPSIHTDHTTEPPPIQNAQGFLYLDDGYTFQDNYEFQGLDILVADNTLTVTKEGDVCADKYSHTIESIVIMGAETIENITMEGNPINFTQDEDSGKVEFQLTYDWCTTDEPLEVKWEY